MQDMQVLKIAAVIYIRPVTVYLIAEIATRDQLNAISYHFMCIGRFIRRFSFNTLLPLVSINGSLHHV